VSEIIGICDELTNIVLSDPDPQSKIKVFMQNYAGDFSVNIQEALEAILKKADKKAS
jgi:hypothetical protein